MTYKSYIWLVAAGMFALASCTTDDVEQPSPTLGSDMTTFTVKIPQRSFTRYGEGESINSLKIAVYEADATNTTPVVSNFEGDVPEIVVKANPFSTTSASGLLQASVQIQLTKDKTYDIVFWAQSSDCTAYTYDAATRTIAVSYDNMSAYDENRDAFYGSVASYVSDGGAQTVILTRPFAQINIGTEDYEAYTAASADNPTTFGMIISGISDQVNLSTGAISASVSDLSATIAAAAPSSVDFPVDPATQKYLAMGYVLVGTAEQPRTLIDVKLTGATASDIIAHYTNIPAQTNYRTNIYGQLLSGKGAMNVQLSAQ